MPLTASIFDIANRVLKGAFEYPQTTAQKRANAIWLVVLFGIGLAVWGYFFSWGQFSLDFHDWAQITGPRLDFLKDAATRLELPLNISNTGALNWVTDRYLSVPDTILSPQSILLRWLSLNTFIIINFWLFYTLGYTGLLIVRSRFQLSPIVFTIIFLLFNFNGHIVSHISVGHYTWLGYFLFPFAVLLLFDLINGDHSWAWVTKWSLLLLLLFLQGSFHQFVWIILFSFLLAVLVPHTFWWAFRGAVFACLLSLVRILPPILVLDRYQSPFYTGYQSLAHLWQSMVDVAAPGDSTGSFGSAISVGSWETTIFISLAGALFLLVFGLVFWLRKNASGINSRLLFPLAAMTLLAMGNLYGYIYRLQIPLLGGERVSTRMVSLVFSFLLIIAAVECQKWLNSQEKTPILMGGFIFWIFFITQDLWENLTVWTMRNIVTHFPPGGFQPFSTYVNNNPGDGGYRVMIVIGLALSLLTMAALGWLSWRERNKPPASFDKKDYIL